MRKLYFILLCLGTLAISLRLAGATHEQDKDLGTLIVTYKTDSKGERLNRIRFWLSDEKGVRNLYPKRTAFVDDPKEPSRMVVIENLPQGRYLLQFLVPNTDSYFQDVHIKEISITQGDVVKIDQHIKPSLIKHANETKLPENLPIPNLASEVKPKNPDQEISLAEEKFPTQTIEPSFGKLIVSFDTTSETLQHADIKFRLINGSSSTHPEPGRDTEVKLKNGKMVMVPQVPAGNYRIEFFTNGEEDTPLHIIEEVHIDPDNTESLHLSIEDNRQTVEELSKQEITEPRILSLTVTANIPTAVFELKNMENEELWRGEGRQHTFEELNEGKYHLSFQSSDPFFVPPPFQIIELSDENPNIEAIFQTLGKLKILSNVNDAEAEITDRDEPQHSTKIKIVNGLGTVYLPDGEYRISFSSREKRKRSPHPVDIHVRSLQTKEVNVYFDSGKS